MQCFFAIEQKPLFLRTTLLDNTISVNFSFSAQAKWKNSFCCGAATSTDYLTILNQHSYKGVSKGYKNAVVVYRPPILVAADPVDGWPMHTSRLSNAHIQNTFTWVRNEQKERPKSKTSIGSGKLVRVLYIAVCLPACVIVCTCVCVNWKGRYVCAQC